MGTDQHLVDDEEPDEKIDENGIGYGWKYLPAELLIEILKSLSYRDIARCCQVCDRWNEVGSLNYIWKRRFCFDFNIKPEVGLHQFASSWKGEYQRVIDFVPRVEFERISEHEDEVLHVSFSNNGMLFCTCSKDATIKVFSADWPFDTVFSDDLSKSPFRWIYTQYSQFSKGDTQLLVSGRTEGTHQSGEIVIYNIFVKQFSLQARVRIMPYDVMGTWLNESHILSGRAHPPSAGRECFCEVLLNKSSQEIENLMHSTVTRLWMILCDNNNALSYLQVADMSKVIAKVHRSITLGCFRGKLHDMHIKAFAEHKEVMQRTAEPRNEIAACSLSFSGHDGTSVLAEGSMGDVDCGKGDVVCEFQNPKCDETSESSDCYSTISRSFSPAFKRFVTDGENDTDSSNLFSGATTPQLTDDELDRDDSESTEQTTGDEMPSHLRPPSTYKLLICFTGNDVNVPHQIGFKRITQEECTDVVRLDLDLERLQQQDRPEIKTDQWDHLIDAGGQLVGMTISPCGRFLYANIRKWTWRVIPGNPRPPRISNKVTLTVIDLVSMEVVDTLHGPTAESNVFFLHISANKHYVASGSEDSQGYLWDRYYGMRLSTFRHEDVVNCVALNPRDPSIAVSVGDDRVIKIWCSKYFHRLLSGARAKARIKPPISS